MLCSIGKVGASSKRGLSVGWLVGVCSSSESDPAGARYPLLDAIGVSAGLKSGCCGSVIRQYPSPSLLSAKIWRLVCVKYPFSLRWKTRPNHELLMNSRGSSSLFTDTCWGR